MKPLPIKHALFLLCLATFFIPSHLAAQYFLDATANLPVQTSGTWAMDAEAADLDQDGDLDIVVANEFRENYVLFNDGSGVFTVDPNRRLPRAEPNASYPGQDSEDIAIADFDSDGDLDLLFVSEDTPEHELLLNNGTGAFAFAAWQFPGSEANGLAVADFNGDNLPDVLIGNKGQNQLYINLGNGTFGDSTASMFPSNSEWTQDLKALDLDFDGDIDILEGCEFGGNNLYMNDGGGNFTEESMRLPFFGPVMETRKLTVGDINGDSMPDIFVANVNWTNGNDPQDRIYRNQPTTAWQDVTLNSMPVDNKTTLEGIFYDVDRDGDQDLIRAGQNGTSPYAYETLLNDGQGVFSVANIPVIQGNPAFTCLGILQADFNGDGMNDLFFANHQLQDRMYFYDSTFVPVNRDPVPIFRMEIGPNPVQDFLRLHWPESVPGEKEVVVTDVQGKVVQMELAQQDLQLSTADWPDGIYLIQARSGAQVWHEKVVKLDE